MSKSSDPYNSISYPSSASCLHSPPGGGVVCISMCHLAWISIWSCPQLVCSVSFCLRGKCPCGLPQELVASSAPASPWEQLLSPLACTVHSHLPSCQPGAPTFLLSPAAAASPLSTYPAQCWGMWPWAYKVFANDLNPPPPPNMYKIPFADETGSRVFEGDWSWSLR